MLCTFCSQIANQRRKALLLRLFSRQLQQLPIVQSHSAYHSKILVPGALLPTHGHLSKFCKYGHSPGIVQPHKVGGCNASSQVRWYSDTPEISDQPPVSTVEHIQPVKAQDIKDFLSKQGLTYKDGYTCYITTCPRLNHTRLKLADIDKTFVNSTTGHFYCGKCCKSGEWKHFKDNAEHMAQFGKTRRRMPSVCLSSSTEQEEELKKEQKKAEAVYESATPISDVDPETTFELRDRLGMQGIKLETMSKFRVRVQSEEGGSGLVLPSFSQQGTVVGVKVAHLLTYTSQGVIRKRLHTKSIPKLEFSSLFGWHLIKAKHTQLVIAASEWDAMMIYQATGFPVVALPRGDSVLPHKVLPYLEQFNKIVLWFGGDIKAWESEKHLSRKLNESRCSLIKPSETQPGPLQAAKQGFSLASIVNAAHPYKHKSITSFKNLRSDVFTMLSQSDLVAGVKWKRYPILNKLLKGHRRGELTIFTGPTGSGKTTFISDYSLDLAMQGVNTLWGSFEINNVKLMKTMLTQFAQKNLVTHIDEFEAWADRFESLPLYFMTFHGQENTRKVIETMSHAVYIHDIGHVIVDNLQFMMGTSGIQGRSSDRFMVQDDIIGAFRRFATHMNCHVTLVIHPRKEKDSDDLTISSIFGSAKASQEADNVLILQDKRLVTPRGKKYVQLVKNRFDGELGVMLLKFDKDSLSFAAKTSASSSSGGGKGQKTQNPVEGEKTGSQPGSGEKATIQNFEETIDYEDS